MCCDPCDLRRYNYVAILTRGIRPYAPCQGSSPFRFEMNFRQGRGNRGPRYDKMLRPGKEKLAKIIKAKATENGGDARVLDDVCQPS